MVTCLVCGKQYEKGDCPRCQFPDIQIPGLDRENAIHHLRPAIEACRKVFLETIKVSLVTYRWKDVNGTVALDREERIPLGTGTELFGNEKWLDGQFARIPDQQKIDVTICVKTNEGEQTKTIAVPNLHKAELQQIGASVDENFRIRLMLRNQSENSTKSDPVALF